MFHGSCSNGEFTCWKAFVPRSTLQSFTQRKHSNTMRRPRSCCKDGTHLYTCKSTHHSRVHPRYIRTSNIWIHQSRLNQYYTTDNYRSTQLNSSHFDALKFSPTTPPNQNQKQRQRSPLYTTLAHEIPTALDEHRQHLYHNLHDEQHTMDDTIDMDSNTALHASSKHGSRHHLRFETTSLSRRR